MLPQRNLMIAGQAVLLTVIPILAATTAYAAWPTTPSGVLVSSAPPRSPGFPLAVQDSCGGIICAWMDTIPGASTIDVQRIDYAGQPRWVLNGFPVNPPEVGAIDFAIAPDTSGGAFVAFTDHRIAGDTTDVYLQHVLSSGAIDPAWPPGGVAVATLAAIQNQPRVVADGHGGALVAWLDYRGNVDFAPDIFAQRISPSGAAMWVANGVPVVQQQRYQGPPMDLVADGAGGLYIAWSDQRISPAQQDIYAQHLDAVSGAPTWPVAGLGVCTATGIQQDVRVTNSLGNLIVVWDDQRAGQNDIYAQGVTIGGSVMWAPNGVQVNGPADPQNEMPVIVPDELGGAIIGWPTHTLPGQIIYGQRLDATGTLLWGVNGVFVENTGLPAGAYLLQAVVDQRGGVVFCWQEGVGGWHDWAQRLDPTGAALWPVNGVEVTDPNPSMGEFSPVLVPDGAAGAILAWFQAGGAADGIYAQQIGAGGLLGVRAASKDCAPDICGHAYTDFGDAPEGFPAYPTGLPGHFPTCIYPSTAGTQEIACGAALSTLPGPTGYVEHVAGWTDAVYFGFGCAIPKAPGFAVDSELDGSTGFGLPSSFPGTSACFGTVPVNEYEKAFGGMWFGADETLADGYDAGLAADPNLTTCSQMIFAYQAWLCGSGPFHAYLNVLVDWNQDGDWNDVVSCPGPAGPISCAPEWCVKNAPVTLSPGCNSLYTPSFATGPNVGPTWMRMTLTSTPVSDDFPWAGSVTAAGRGPTTFAGGETEDYPLMISTSTGVGDAAGGVAFRLDLPAPNPSPGSVTLRFALPKTTRAELGVYDLAGRRVRTMLAGTLDLGAHTLVWDGRETNGSPARAGLYYVRLRTDEGVRSQCLVLTR